MQAILDKQVYFGYILLRMIEKIRKLTKEARQQEDIELVKKRKIDAQKKIEKEETWANQIITSIEKKAEEAARQGKDMVMVLNMGIDQVTDDKVYTSEINANVIRKVKEFCLESGFMVKEDNTAYRDRYAFYPRYRLFIVW